MRAAPHAVESAIAWCNSMVHLNCGRCPGVLEIIRNLAICKRAKRNSTATPDKDAAAGAPGKLTASLAVSKNSADAPRSPKLGKKGAFHSSYTIIPSQDTPEASTYLFSGVCSRLATGVPGSLRVEGGRWAS